MATLAQDQAALRSPCPSRCGRQHPGSGTRPGGSPWTWGSSSNSSGSGPCGAPVLSTSSSPACAEVHFPDHRPPASYQVTSPALDHEAQLAFITGGGEPSKGSQPDALAAAVLAQSNALVSLVGQLAQGSSEPRLDAPSSTSVRGALSRQRLQQELCSPGSFAKKVRQNAAQRMNPTGLGEPDIATMTRYLERFGGYGKQPCWPG